MATFNRSAIPLKSQSSRTVYATVHAPYQYMAFDAIRLSSC